MMKSALLKRWLPVRPAADGKRRPSRSSGAPVLLGVAGMVVALLVGAVAGLDSPILLTLLAGPMLALLLFFTVNAQGMLLSLFAVTFLVQGSLLYFLNLRQATWVAVGMALLFIMRIVMDQMVRRRQKDVHTQPVTIMYWVMALAGCYCLALVLNRPAVGQVAASLKSFWPMFGVLIAFYWVRWTPARLRQLWQLMIVITLIQVPVTLYQHLFIASRKVGGFDSVVGTFGGTQLGGGLSAVMAFFVVVTLAFVLALWNRTLMSTRRMLFVVVATLIVILLGEVKASVIWLPIAVFFILRKRALRNIRTLIAYGCAAAVMCSAIYVTYNQLYWAGNMDRLDTIGEKLDSAGGYFFDPDNLNYVTGEVSRGASLALWVSDRATGPMHRLLGYGPNASKSGGLMGAGAVSKRFAPLHIDATALAVLLWDYGIAGALAYIGLIAATMRAGWRFVKAGQGSATQLAAAETSVLALGLSFSLLIYNRSLVDEPTMQLLILFCAGYIVQCARFGAHPAEAADAAVSVALPKSRLVLRPAS